MAPETLSQPLLATPKTGVLASVDAILQAARAGRPFILVDTADPDDEGDLILPAGFASTEQIAFMAREARGLIQLALDEARVAALRLDLQPVRGAPKRGDFTVSIEARTGVTTGISAADRARTIAVAIDPDNGPEDLVTPGHIFPLATHSAGVLGRARRAEAAIDITKLAGLPPAAVLCTVIGADGATARLDELQDFAERHGLLIGTLAELIAHRRRAERRVEPVIDGDFETQHGGPMRIHVFRDTLDGTEHLALVKDGQGAPPLVRMHQIDMAADILGHVEARRDYVPAALRMMADYPGPAVAVFLRDGDPAWISRRLIRRDLPYAENETLRDYGVGAEILRALGVTEMILLSSSNRKVAALEGYGLHILEQRPIPPAS